MTAPRETRDPSAEIERLWRRRPYDRFLAGSHLLWGAVLFGPWLAGRFDAAGLVTARRLDNLRRFADEATPYPLQDRDFALDVLLSWLGELMAEKGIEALATTFAISIVAILLAGLVGAVLGLVGARNLASPEPFLPWVRPPSRLTRLGWQGLVWVGRAVMIFSRSLPAYVWAFLLLALLGPTAWPAILALAIHNTGILGKLSSEIVENIEPAAPSALRGLGASRAQLAIAALVPTALPRFLLFFFYRWETCVRQATILGLLGIVSLGYWIQDARARNHYDEMLLFVLLGSLLVLVGDLVSMAVRELLRRSS